MARAFTDKEREILRLVQGNIPDSAELREDGAIRRFGATLRHQKAGYRANVMVAWRIPEADAEAVGSAMAEHPMVSHCYLRPASDQWPYNLYTMVHGRSREDCLAVVDELKQRTGRDDCQMLFSTKELKKTSMTYF
jgi:DNA-binding Lrp family transcriptional regulator